MKYLSETEYIIKSDKNSVDIYREEAYSEDSLASIYSVHASVTHVLLEGESPQAREAGDLGPANAESPALFFISVLSSFLGERRKTVHLICYPNASPSEALGQDRSHVDCRSDVKGILTDIAARVIIHRRLRTRWPTPGRLWNRVSVPKRGTGVVYPCPRPTCAWR